VSIICYHAVDPTLHSRISVDPDSFALQIAWLASHRRVVPLREAVRMMDGHGRLPAGVASITFDDGFASVHEWAMPILLREGVHATIFVVPGTLEGPNAGKIDWVKDAHALPRALSAAQILDLRDAGFEIGSHSFAHRDLPTLDEGEIVADLRRSREVLEDLVDRPVGLLAYPFGNHDERVRIAAKVAGFEASFGMADTDLPVSLPHATPRVGLYRGQGTRTLRAKTSRWFWRVRASPLHPLIAWITSLRRPAI
jgi:peptidoglycan/xylan/chitin deacetylase (PgdA/CDA1 family)